MISERRWLTGISIALSVAPPEDLAACGMGPEHLRDALGEISRQLLALGAQLIYGGDLRSGGITELLFELAARYALPLEQRDKQVPAIIDVLAFPMHANLTSQELLSWESEFAPTGELRYLDPDGEAWSFKTRPERLEQLSKEQWPAALTAMRSYVTHVSDARIVLGGKTRNYEGNMPGIIEEALISTQASQPLFVIGGFGGAAQGIARQILSKEPTMIPGVDHAYRIGVENGLAEAELMRLAVSPHIDEIAVLITRGLRQLFAKQRRP